MVDLHNHLLPGLDDGPPDLATAVEMARIAARDGITHMVCTPHASSRYAFDPDAAANGIAELKDALEEVQVPLTLGMGCDFHLNYENLQDAFAHPRRYTINASEYLLVELPDHILPPSFEQTLYELRLAGMTPILTHPERNPALQQNPAKLLPWVRNGLLVQVTASSVTGGMGKPAQRIAQRLLTDRWAHFLASDAHNTGHRPPGMQQARDWVAQHCDPEYAQLVTEDNPAAVFHGRPLPQQPEPLRLYDDLEEDIPWWKRLFGR